MVSNQSHWIVSAIVGLAMAMPGLARANFVINGSFEEPIGGGFFVAGDTIGAWDVLSNDVEVITEALWEADDGSQSVDMSGGSSAGVIAQDLSLASGGLYNLSFALAGNPGGGPVIKELQVFWGGDSQGIFTFDTTGRTFADMGWETITLLNLVAPSDTVELRFASLNASGYGPTLDNVAVELSAVPEPSGLVSAALGLAGLAGYAGWRRGRPRRAA